MERAQASPVIIDENRNPNRDPVRLEHISLDEDQGTYNENWLQRLIHNNPELLPIHEIKTGFGKIIPAAREIHCGHGAIDNLFLTPEGGIIIVEVKLWRNPKARREVVAQALDYVAALTQLKYEDFEKKVVAARAKVVAARAEGGTPTLYDVVKDYPNVLEEARFIDAIANNLARGQILVIALGDGIHAEAEKLFDLLQSHAGAHFTFALVEIRMWRNTETQEIVAVGNTLAKTEMIERGVVRVEEGRAVVEPVKPASTPSRMSFDEKMSGHNRSLPEAIQSFLKAVNPLGVEDELKESLNFKVKIPGFDRPINLGYIRQDGFVRTSHASEQLPREILEPYFATLADAIGGKAVDSGNNPSLTTDGKSAPRIEQLLPDHLEVWVSAVEKLVDAARSAGVERMEEVRRTDRI